MHLTEHGLCVSTDIAGVIDAPFGFTKSVYDQAGYENYDIEGVGFPLLTLVLFARYLLGLPLDKKLISIHARTGQMNAESKWANSPIDMIKLGLAEPFLPDLTEKTDLWMLKALSKLGTNTGQLSWLIHDTEIDSEHAFKRYVDIFTREEFKNVFLYIENAPIRGSLRHTLDLYSQFVDAGVKNIRIVGDSVHYLRSRGVGLNDIKTISKVWEQMIRYFENANIVKLHFSDGTDLGDSHNVNALWEAGLLAQLGRFIEERGIIFEKECQHGPFGPKDLDEEIERQKDLGGIELRANLFHEKYFRMKV